MRRDTGVLLCALLAGLAALVLGCQSASPVVPSAEPDGPAWFEDVTDQVGLNFLHDVGVVGTYAMPEQVGSGAALFDFDKDGRLDIYLLNNGGPKGRPNVLYRQQPDGTFLDVSKGSGLDSAGYCMGVAVGDVNNDTWPDVLVTLTDGVRLYLNNGDGTFTDSTQAARLTNPGWAVSAAFVDYDRDGWLDLVVANYVDYDPTWPCHNPRGQRDYCAPRTFRGRVSRLFHNRGPAAVGGPRVQFEDVTESSGLGRLPGPGLGVVAADFNGDGWTDLFIANDGAPNHLWINRQNGTFTEEGTLYGVAVNGMGRAEANMGIALGDVDGDGLFDLYVTHLTEETNTLWKQGPRGVFRDHTSRSGLLQSSWRGTGFGTVLADFDNDGALDLAIANGRVSALATAPTTTLGPFWSKYADRNQVFAGDGKGNFRDLAARNPALCGGYTVARGLARGDIDRDGAQDLLVTAIGRKARLYRNVAPKRGHWFEVRAVTATAQRDASGAEVRVRAGDRTWVAWVNPAESYACSSEAVAHFGVGEATRIDVIEVLWPNGVREVFPGKTVDQRIEVRQSARPPG